MLDFFICRKVSDIWLYSAAEEFYTYNIFKMHYGSAHTFRIVCGNHDAGVLHVWPRKYMVHSGVFLRLPAGFHLRISTRSVAIRGRRSFVGSSSSQALVGWKKIQEVSWEFLVVGHFAWRPVTGHSLSLRWAREPKGLSWGTKESSLVPKALKIFGL